MTLFISCDANCLFCALAQLSGCCCLFCTAVDSPPIVTHTTATGASFPFASLPVFIQGSFYRGKIDCFPITFYNMLRYDGEK